VGNALQAAIGARNHVFLADELCLPLQPLCNQLRVLYEFRSAVADHTGHQDFSVR
jgi:hypothetical protein